MDYLIIIISVIVVLAALAVGAYFIFLYNSLIRIKNNITKSWANIDVLLKQRSDEIPKIVDTVKGYVTYERDVLTKLTEARTKFLNANTVAEKAAADNMISGALKTVFAVAENYPNLKASENFLQLQNRVSGIENELSDRREFYNDSVNEYNIKILSIPDVIIARRLGYPQPEPMFKVKDEEKNDVKIDFQ